MRGAGRHECFDWTCQVLNLSANDLTAATAGAITKVPNAGLHPLSVHPSSVHLCAPCSPCLQATAALPLRVLSLEENELGSEGAHAWWGMEGSMEGAMGHHEGCLQRALCRCSNPRQWPRSQGQVCQAATGEPCSKMS